uniref:Replication protein A 70 kDa DNA-binding subunit B/D first OB fold domain-containing protein n=1 Tax=Daucus carota subsp. sativus TaxID=79200 RepID=A0A175YH35_DAUCS
MAEIPYQMISNLRPQITTAWRLKVRVTRIWQAITQQGDTVGINCIFVDELGGRIRAWIAAANMNQLQSLITEGETYNVHNFVVRQYGAMQTERCFGNDFSIQLCDMTNMLVAEDVYYIQRHVFQFTNLSAIIDAARENNFLIGEVKLTNYPATRFFINLHHEAVEDLRDALTLVNSPM